MLDRKQLLEKWSPVLDHASLPKIADAHRREVTAIILENQENANVQDHQQSGFLGEAAPANVGGPGLAQGAAGAGAVAGYDPVLISLVRRAMPQLMAYDVLGVQALTQPTGLIFAMKSRYTSQAGAEALYNKPDRTQSGELDGTATPTTTAEGKTPADMAFSIEKTLVQAKSRMLRAEYSLELAQDLKSVHGLDAEAELSTILSHEILAEINREIIETLTTSAVAGCATGTTTAGTYDLDTDSNGRWSVEKFKGLMFQIEREANVIAQQTRRGKGNFIICTSDVASALAMAGVLDYAPAIQANLNVDEASTTFAGVLNGKFKVYVDPYAGGATNVNITGATQSILVGYKGQSAFDAGMFYCPYTALQMVRAVDPLTFQPKLGFKTRYGIVANPFAAKDMIAANGLVAGNNIYYRKFSIQNLM